MVAKTNTECMPCLWSPPVKQPKMEWWRQPEWCVVMSPPFISYPTMMFNLLLWRSGQLSELNAIVIYSTLCSVYMELYCTLESHSYFRANARRDFTEYLQPPTPSITKAMPVYLEITFYRDNTADLLLRDDMSWFGDLCMSPTKSDFSLHVFVNINRQNG